MPEIIGLFLKNTAIGRFVASSGLKILLWGALVLAVAGAAYFVYSKFEALQTQVKAQAATILSQATDLGVKEQKIADQKAAIDTLKEELHNAQLTQANNDKAEADLKAVVATNQTKHDAAVTKLHDYVKTVEDNKTIPEDQKSYLVAASYIEHLWTGHCDLTDGANPTCARFATTPPTQLTPAKATDSPPPEASPNTAAPSSVSPPIPTRISQTVLHDDLQQLVAFTSRAVAETA